MIWIIIVGLANGAASDAMKLLYKLSDSNTTFRVSVTGAVVPESDVAIGLKKHVYAEGESIGWERD